MRLGCLNITSNPDYAKECFQECIETHPRALNERAYATGAVTGQLKQNLGLALLGLGNLNIINNSAEAEQYFKASGDAFRNARDEPANATYEITTRLISYAQESNEALRLAQAVTKGKMAGGDFALRRCQDRIERLLFEISAVNPGPQVAEPSREKAQTRADGDSQQAQLAYAKKRQEREIPIQETEYSGATPRDADTKPPHTTSSNKLTKRDPDLKKWENIRATIAEEGGLVLSSENVKEFKFKNIPLSLVNLGGIERLKISGDLRDIPDLGGRLGKFPDLKKAVLRNTKIDELDIEKLPPKLHTIDLTDSVVPLPLQERLKDHFKARRDGIRKGLVILTDRDKQIENYEGETLKEWVKKGASVPGAKRREAGRKTREYLRSKPNPGELDVSGNSIGEFDEDWHSMVASNELKVLRIGGNQLPELDLAKVALSPNLAIVDASNNAISHVPNADKIGRLRSLKTLDMHKNRLGRLPDGIEYAPESSTIDLTENKLSSFAKIDAKLIKFAQRERLEFEASRQHQRGPTIVTDHIVDDDLSVASGAFHSSILEKLDEKIPEIAHVENELKTFGADVESHKRWRNAGDLVEREAYVEALEIVMTSQGGPFKIGHMQRYHDFSQLAATIACNRASTLLPLEGQPPVSAGTIPRLKALRAGTEVVGAAGRFIPVAGGYVSGAAKAAGMVMDAASTRYFNDFHRDFLKVFPVPEHQMLCRVLPLAKTLTMGEQLVSKESETFQEDEDHPNEPSPQRLFELFKWAAGKKQPSDAIERRAFRDTANLLGDIATGKAFDIPNNANKEAALREKLHGMTFDQKMEEVLTYWANRHNSEKEPLPFKNRYILSDSPLVKQLATIAMNYTLTDIAQEIKIRDLESQFDDEKGKRHEEKRKRRAMTKQLKDEGGMDFLELSDWKSESEDDKAWWAKKFPPKSPSADLSSEEGISSSGKGKEPAAGTARRSILPASSAKSATSDKASLLGRAASNSSQDDSSEETLNKTRKGEKSDKPEALHQTDSDDSLYGSRAAGTEASRNQTRVLVQARGVQRRSASQDSSSRESSPHGR